jgi:hypothetical protein
MDCLSNETIKLLKNIHNISKNNFIKNSFTTNKFFMNLYKNIKIIINKIKIDKLSITLINENYSKYLNNNKFTSENIMNKIYSKIKYCYKCTFENNTILYYTKSKKYNKNVIIHMFKMIKLLKILFNRNNYDQLIIYFETDEKKKFPKKGTIIGPDNVNSGLTYLDLHKNGKIILYRKQELLKVLIHELIHSNLIDSDIIFSKKIKSFSNNFCVSYNILLNEAFTESIATIINIFYIHITCKFKMNMLNSMFDNELFYSNYIISKIMNFYDISKINDILKKEGYCKNNFPQKTNVFAYYILKNILLTKYDDFGKLLEKYSKNYKLVTEKGVNELINLIINNINILDNNLINIKNDKNKTLRLCLYEIDL